jgi:hypothetical protein
VNCPSSATATKYESCLRSITKPSGEDNQPVFAL